MFNPKWALSIIVITCCLTTNLLTAHARGGKAVYHEHTSAMVTCARYEPHGSILKVTNPETGRTITVRVNGRGPFNGNRILDLSTGAFRALYGSLRRGVGPVRYVVVRRGWGKRTSKAKSKRKSR